jgi:electron transport complex protein RnfB
VRLAALLGQEPRPLDPACGRETAPQVALIDETACIGCAKCLDACPVDAIIGARKRMHTVLTDWCTGCERCLPPCPVDCIRMLPATRELPPPDLSRARYQAHVARQAHAQAVRAHRLYALEAETIENVVTEDMTRPGIGTPVSAPA